MRVLIHFDEYGMFEIHTDQEVKVIVCDDRARDDWAYEMSSCVHIGTIDDLLGDAEIGSAHDSKREDAEMQILYGKPKDLN